ncbi:tetratricopeptide repeat-containing glycosyltransferase family protein [Thalassospiraceae bacterium LMO-SO8]|nr:tetratricopeptide repeat-containing glycosyltransferase family protein [Alphaproteobacteria bacterium LMO-S08]WND74602.1 tetratricopeptide repeat-containing glycosyltransferase family protein [Thalassospiraceae bacterium LMO-SO8]
MADIATLFKQAEAAWRAGHGAEAKAAAEQVLADDPAHAGALMILTNLCFAAGDVAGARPHLTRLAALMPDEVMIRNNLGRACLAAEDLGAAAEAFAAVLQTEPANARALDGLGIVRHRQGDYVAAADLHGRAVAADPEFAAGWCNLGIACTDLGRYADGAAALDRALVLDPEDARTRFNRSVLHLMAGETAAGWPMYEARLAFQNIAKLRGARWNGEPLAGERVLLIPEQGFGDVIQFARFASRVRDRGGVPVLAVPGPLTALMAAQGWDIDIVDAAAPPEAPLWCPLMSLGAVLDLTAGDISGAAYLCAPSIDNGQNAGPRVGLAWAGNPTHRRDRARSLRLAELAPLFNVPGIRFVNLQVGLRPDDAAEMARRPDLFAETPGLGTFAETAAVVAGLDLVISADTAVLHLAGAMGRPVWGLLPFVPDWRWGLSGETTPWYDSLCLYRQPALGDWRSVATQVAADLGRLGKG